MVVGGAAFGGQLMITTDVENYPGFEQGIMGPELMDVMKKQAARFGTEIRFEEVVEADLVERGARDAGAFDVFEECFDSQKHYPRIKASQNEAMRRGVAQTPTFIIGSAVIPGNAPIAVLRKAVNEALGRARKTWVDLLGAVHSVNTALPHLEKSKGSVIFISTTAAMVVCAALVALFPIIANTTLGLRSAIMQDRHLAAGLQTCAGKVTHAALARDLGMPFVAPEQALA